MDRFNPDQLALARGPVKPLPLAAQRKAPRHQPGEKFLKGPIPMNWLNRAAGLPGKALHVGIALWHLAGLTRHVSTVSLSATVLRDMGISRTTGYRALAALEEAGLVRVERQPGRLSRVTILAIKAEP
jgi:DNA-binding MarR family transcriptional regulator